MKITIEEARKIALLSRLGSVQKIWKKCVNL